MTLHHTKVDLVINKLIATDTPLRLSQLIKFCKLKDIHSTNILSSLKYVQINLHIKNKHSAVKSISGIDRLLKQSTVQNNTPALQMNQSFQKLPKSSFFKCIFFPFDEHSFQPLKQDLLCTQKLHKFIYLLTFKRHDEKRIR